MGEASNTLAVCVGAGAGEADAEGGKVRRGGVHFGRDAAKEFSKLVIAHQTLVGGRIGELEHLPPRHVSHENTRAGRPAFNPQKEPRRGSGCGRKRARWHESILVGRALINSRRELPEPQAATSAPPQELPQPAVQPKQCGPVRICKAAKVSGERSQSMSGAPVAGW